MRAFLGLPALALVVLASGTPVPATVPAGSSAVAQPAASRNGPVGGPLLVSSGVVVDAGTGPLPETSAASYVVADLDTGAVLAAKDPHGRYAPASTLKTLTALTLIPRLDPTTQVTPAAADVGVDGSKVGLVEQLSYSVHDLFAALLVTSANDAAGALATAVGGQDAAAALMNAKATELQAQDTHAVNTSGLDADGQLSSAYDLALIARAGMALPDFRSYVATRRGWIPAPGGQTIEIDNHNRLLASYPGTIGIKNGFTTAARASLVVAATRGGRTLLVTQMRAEPVVWMQAEQLLDWGFAAAANNAKPVGQLVGARQPTPAAAGGSGAADDPSAADSSAANSSGPGRRSATGSPDLGSGLPVRSVAVGLAAAAAGVLLRRRQVVRRRARRRAAVRASA